MCLGTASLGSCQAKSEALLSTSFHDYEPRDEVGVDMKLGFL